MKTKILLMICTFSLFAVNLAYGRWLNGDPLAHKMPSISIYAYCADNPISFSDPTGMTLEERTQAIAYMRSVLKTPHSVLDCSAAVGNAITSAGVEDKKVAHGAEDRNKNGVELIAENTTQIDMEDLEAGNAVTFKSGRSDHKGDDGEFDHIGIVSSVDRDPETNKISNFMVIHSSSSQGIVEQKYDMKKGMPGFQLKNAYKWDTPDSQGNTNTGTSTSTSSSTNTNTGTQTQSKEPLAKQNMKVDLQNLRNTLLTGGTWTHP